MAANDTGRPDQIWSIAGSREDTGFKSRITSKDPNDRDIAVLVSVADNVEPLFASCQARLPPLRALVQVTKPDTYPHTISSARHATDVAFVIQEGMRTARREYGNVGTIHLFMAVPAGLAIMVGQLLDTFGTVQTYEHVIAGGSEQFKPAALLRPGI